MVSGGMCRRGRSRWASRRVLPPRTTRPICMLRGGCAPSGVGAARRQPPQECRCRARGTQLRGPEWVQEAALVRDLDQIDLDLARTLPATGHFADDGPLHAPAPPRPRRPHRPLPWAQSRAQGAAAAAAAHGRNGLRAGHVAPGRDASAALVRGGGLRLPPGAPRPGTPARLPRPRPAAAPSILARLFRVPRAASPAPCCSTSPHVH